MHSALCTVHYEHYALCPVHYAQYTMHIALCTMHSSQFTVHHAQCRGGPMPRQSLRWDPAKMSAGWRNPCGSQTFYNRWNHVLWVTGSEKALVRRMDRHKNVNSIAYSGNTFDIWNFFLSRIHETLNLWHVKIVATIQTNLKIFNIKQMVRCHVSHVTCHVSHVMCHLSPVTCHLSLTQTATVTDLSPAYYPTIYTRLVSKKKQKVQKQKII